MLENFDVIDRFGLTEQRQNGERGYPDIKCQVWQIGLSFDDYEKNDDSDKTNMHAQDIIIRNSATTNG
jgi:hypothetical protein